MPRMKFIALVTILSVPGLLMSLLQTDLGAFDAVLRALAELPLVGSMAWILLRQQDKHLEALSKLTDHWLQRARERDQFYQGLLTGMLDTIGELAKK